MPLFIEVASQVVRLHDSRHKIFTRDDHKIQKGKTLYTQYDDAADWPTSWSSNKKQLMQPTIVATIDFKKIPNRYVDLSSPKWFAAWAVQLINVRGGYDEEPSITSSEVSYTPSSIVGWCWVLTVYVFIQFIPKKQYKTYLHLYQCQSGWWCWWCWSLILWNYSH